MIVIPVYSMQRIEKAWWKTENKLAIFSQFSCHFKRIKHTLYAYIIIIISSLILDTHFKLSLKNII